MKSKSKNCILYKVLAICFMFFLFYFYLLNPSRVFAATSTNWVKPTAYTTDYKNYPDYNDKSLGYHGGTDLVATTGTAVYSTCDGVVEWSGPYTHWSYGNIVKIKAVMDGNTVFIYYEHLSSWNVSAGDVVSAGQLIGAVGATGNVTGPHLHYEIRTKDDNHQVTISPYFGLPGSTHCYETINSNPDPTPDPLNEQIGYAFDILGSGNYMKTYTKNGSGQTIPYTTSELSVRGSKTHGASSSAYIDNTKDELYLYSVGKNSKGQYWIYCSYPSGSGRSYAYIDAGALVDVVYNGDQNYRDSKIKVELAPRYTSSVSSSYYVSPGDSIFIIGHDNSSSKYLISYPISAGNRRLAWCTGQDLDNMGFYGFGPKPDPTPQPGPTPSNDVYARAFQTLGSGNYIIAYAKSSSGQTIPYTSADLSTRGSKTNGPSSGAYIDNASDELYLYSVGKNSKGQYWVYCSYPSGGSRSYAYINYNSLVDTVYTNSDNSGNSATRCDLYPRYAGSKNSSYYVASGDKYFVIGSDSGAAKYCISYPISLGNWRMAWCTAQELNSIKGNTPAPIPVENYIAAPYSALGSNNYIKAYAKSSSGQTIPYISQDLTTRGSVTHGASSGAFIDNATDELYLYSVGKNSNGQYWVYCSYPSGSSRSYAYINYNALVDGFYTNTNVGNSTTRCSLYPRYTQGKSDSYYVAAGDKVYIIGYDSGKSKYMISYPISSGNWRMAWCNYSDLQSMGLIKCNHSWNSGSVITQATCQKQGVKTYKCSLCGETKTEPIAATQHNTVIDVAVAATCSAGGKTEGSHCSMCGTVFQAQANTNPTGHLWDDGVVIKNPTCLADGEMKYTCRNCSQTYVEPIFTNGHTGNDVLKFAKNPTCLVNGYTGDVYCDECGDIIFEGEPINATGHQSQVIINQKTATYDEDGYTGDTYCNDCQQVIKSGETIPRLRIIVLEKNQNILTCSLKSGMRKVQQGIVYGNSSNVTLEAKGRTRIAYNTDQMDKFTFDISGLSGIYIKAYVEYIDSNGMTKVEYSESYYIN